MGKWFKIGIALGGGGARGLAHLGVLCALDREQIPIDLMAGTSMGSLVAAAYAQTLRCDDVTERFRRYLASKEFQSASLEFLHNHDQNSKPSFAGIFQRFAAFIRRGVFYSQSLTKKAPISEEVFVQNVDFLLAQGTFEETKIPLAVVALDLKSGEEVVLREGPLTKAVSASCAIPGILPPVVIGERSLVDGGWINRVPVGPVRRMGADLVIAVDVAEDIQEARDYDTGLDIVLRAYDITQNSLSQCQLREADVVIRPDVSGIHWSDFGHLDECLRAGEEAVEAKRDDIRRLIRRKKVRKALLLPLGPASSP
jgi:NTE family protein